MRPISDLNQPKTSPSATTRKRNTENADIDTIEYIARWNYHMFATFSCALDLYTNILSLGVFHIYSTKIKKIDQRQHAALGHDNTFLH